MVLNIRTVTIKQGCCTKEMKDALLESVKYGNHGFVHLERENECVIELLNFCNLICVQRVVLIALIVERTVNAFVVGTFRNSCDNACKQRCTY